MKDIYLSMGILLSIIGVSLGGVIKLFFATNFSWISTLISALSILLMIDLNRMMRLKYQRPTVIVWAMFFYSFITLILASLGNQYRSGPYSTINQLFYFAQIIVLWDRKKDINTEIFLKVALWIMLPFEILSFSLIMKNGTLTGGLAFNYLLKNTETTVGVSRVTLAAVGFTGFIAALSYKASTRCGKMARYLCMVVSMAVLGLAARRSVFIAVGIAIFLHIRNSSTRTTFINKKRMLSFVIWTVILSFVLYRMYATNATVKEMTDRAIDSLVRGLQTYLGVNNTDLAASMRRENINTIPSEYLNNSTFCQFLFGRGYMAKWLDIPFMQAFWDLGLIGGIFYLWIMCLVPIKHLLPKAENGATMFAQYNLGMSFVECFANGAPYGRFFALMLLLALEGKEKDNASAVN